MQEDQSAAAPLEADPAPEVTAAAPTPNTAPAKADANAASRQAKVAVRDQIETATAAASKLLTAAAGELVDALSPEEAAAISVIVHNVPPQFAPEVQAFAANAASFEGPINAAAGVAVQHGLAWALTWLHVAHDAAEKALA